MEKIVENRPFVSIALITYNGAKYLEKQLNSLLCQTYQNFEIVVSDDGSTDGTTDILNKYVLKDSRIQWSKNKFERGFIRNAQNVISLCKGEIIFLCDQDDWWHKDKIALHLDAYKDSSVKWVYNRLVLANNEEKEIGLLEDTVLDYYDRSRMKLLNYVWGSCIAACLTSYRREILLAAMPIGENAPGHDAWIQLAIWPAKSYRIDTVLQWYRIHDANVVGWGKVRSEKEVEDIEKKAIKDNLIYLRSLAKDSELQFWKRIFFLAVYFAKMLRIKFK